MEEKNKTSFKTTELYGTESLCFDKNDFTKDDFKADTFVQVHQASSMVGLDILRDDLGSYLKILRSAMIDLINRDYADFVNLSSNLTGLDKHINALKTPLGQLREEVLSVEELLSDAISNISKDLERRHIINRHKSLLHRINEIYLRLTRLELLLDESKTDLESAEINSVKHGETKRLSQAEIETNLVDRVASEVNHLNFLVAQCEGAALLDVFKPRVNNVRNFVEKRLEKSLEDGVKSTNQNTQSTLTRTLRTYASLGTVNHAHNFVRNIIKERLESVISENNLRKDPRGLKGMFDQILNIVKAVCGPLANASLNNGHDSITGFSFFRYSAWPEVISILELNLPSIFNAGNPALFHQRYLEGAEFLKSFESLLKKELDQFNSSKDYQAFIQLWNLPVYYQIRYQEIGQVMESGLSGENSLSKCKNENNFCLHSSKIVSDSLQKCYDSEIFLEPLLHKFWKLTLLMLARHRTFIRATLSDIQKNLESLKSKSFKISEQTKISLNSNKKSDKNAPTNKKSDKNAASNKKSDANFDQFDKSDVGDVNILIFFMHDVAVLSEFIGEFFSKCMQKNVKNLDAVRIKMIQDSLLDQSSRHLAQNQSIIDVISNHLIHNMTSFLKQVSDTPRIYRRTNKPSPSTHQPYVSNVFEAVNAFRSCSRNLLPEVEVLNLLEGVFEAVSKEYYNFCLDVLSSVYKMEESLRRLKKARERGAQNAPNKVNGGSDDDKIRAQIYLDVLYFGSQMTSLGLDNTAIESYMKALQMVVNAKEGNFSP